MNPHLRRIEKPQKSVTEYVQAIVSGNRVVLSQAITLIESTKTEHQATAQAIISACLPHANRSLRIGITGTPGVGKSTFIETFGTYLCDKEQKKVAVLAIDPSSQVTRGSILGDKTRMMRLSTNPSAFIRPSAAGSSLGGVARKTRETIILCEAAGFDTIIVETVGVGQSEIAVQSMTDFFLLLLLPGAGDELQGIKRGIVEIADLIAVNKADGERNILAKQAQAFYKNALHLLPPTQSQWIPQVTLCSALSGMGIAETWQLINDYHIFTQNNGFFQQKRQSQTQFWFSESINEALRQHFYQNPMIQQQITSIQQQIEKGEKTPFIGAEELIQLFMR